MKRRTNIQLGTRLLVILFLMGVGLITAYVISKLLFMFKGGLLTMLTLQDVMAFIVPGLVAMLIFYYRPLHVMGLDRAPSWSALIIIILFYLISLPAMNWLVSVNQAMTLPSWMSGMEQWMKATEDSAAETTQSILNIHTVPSLLMTVFVVGFMAGLSEEILFRGTIQRTCEDSRLNTHAVVWIVAIVFSAFHLQFYGFVPRMLLGVWLGYLLVWTRSLWVPIIAHTLNNSTVVIFSYLANKGIVGEDYGDNLGLPADGSLPWLALLSLASSIGLAVWAHRHFCKDVLPAD